MTLEEAYKILGLSSSASLDDAKTAYRFLISKYNPDQYRRDELDNSPIDIDPKQKARELNAAIKCIQDSAGCQEKIILDNNSMMQRKFTIGNNIVISATSIHESPFEPVDDLREHLKEMIDASDRFNVLRVSGTIKAIANSKGLLSALSLCDNGGNTLFHYATEKTITEGKAISVFFNKLCELAYNAGFYFGITNKDGKKPRDLYSKNKFVGREFLLQNPNLSYACRLLDKFFSSVKDKTKLSKGLQHLSEIAEQYFSDNKYHIKTRLTQYSEIAKKCHAKQVKQQGSFLGDKFSKNKEPAELWMLYSLIQELNPEKNNAVENDISCDTLKKLEQALVTYILTHREQFDILIDPIAQRIIFAEENQAKPVLQLEGKQEKAEEEVLALKYNK